MWEGIEVVKVDIYYNSVDTRVLQNLILSHHVMKYIYKSINTQPSIGGSITVMTDQIFLEND